jgi:hypothetical protein
MTRLTAHSPLLFLAGRTYKTRCGASVWVREIKGEILYGNTLTAFPIQMQWKRDGKKVPGGGTDPFDLTEAETESE